MIKLKKKILYVDSFSLENYDQCNIPKNDVTDILRRLIIIQLLVITRNRWRFWIIPQTTLGKKSFLY